MSKTDGQAVIINKQKNNAVQILRAFAIIAVVMIHTYPTGSVFGVVLRPFINFAVAMFIFLSGYLTKTEIPDYKAFMIKRLKRVIIPYIIWSVIYMIPQGFDGFVIKLLTGRCCGIYYYIFVYIQFVVLTPLIIKLIKSKYRHLGWLITPVFVIVFQYILNILGYSDVSDQFKYLFAAWFVFYYAGMFVGNGIMTFNKSTSWCVSMYAIAIAVSILGGMIWYNCNNYSMATTQLRLASIATSLIAVLWAGKYIKIGTVPEGALGKVLLALGNTSFGIYLSHILIRGAMKLMPVYRFLVFPLNAAIVLVLSCICVLIGKKILGKYSWMLGL